MSRAEGGKRKRLTGVLKMERVPLVNCIELQMRWPHGSMRQNDPNLFPILPS